MKTYSTFSCCYLPPIEYFYYLVQENHAIIDVNENFVKQTFRNRCSILSPNGKLDLVIPLLKKGKQTKIKNIKIAYYENWQKVHWKSIEAAYRSSPYFEYYEDEFKTIFLEGKPTLLIDFNLKLINKIVELIGIPIEIVLSDKYINKDETKSDFRSISPKKKPSLNFSDYIQVFSSKTGFEPNLSILDLLFNEGPNTKNYLVSSVIEH
ncbi:WbqC family protein [Vicingus serpentipes]|uniref:WbqC family protein n=1 Tax=Vicingus serpentipes TaxID=1926625 RepID=A0A5C6RX07_9FLAO|nr:WbqC family protein [Vicingus serpentipes]TXB66624.1 WbqC family protein [Vicingus serpentipes]